MLPPKFLVPFNFCLLLWKHLQSLDFAFLSLLTFFVKLCIYSNWHTIFTCLLVRTSYSWILSHDFIIPSSLALPSSPYWLRWIWKETKMVSVPYLGPPIWGFFKYHISTNVALCYKLTVIPYNDSPNNFFVNPST